MLVLPPRGGAFNDLHLYQYHPIPSYTILYLTYIHLAPLCMCMCVSCIRSCTYVAKLATLQCQVTHSHGAWIHQNQIFIKGSPRLWKLCAFRNKGRKGVAINFVTNNDVRIMKDLERPVCLYVCLGTDQNVAATCCYTAFVTVQPLVLPLQVGSCTAKSRSSSLHFLLATSICNLYMSCQSFTIIQHPHKPANV